MADDTAGGTSMNANVMIKIDDLQQPAAELTPEQMQVVVGGGYIVCRRFETPVIGPYGTEDEFIKQSHWDCCKQIGSEVDEDCTLPDD
jgi:hypothetical protein